MKLGFILTPLTKMFALLLGLQLTSTIALAAIQPYSLDSNHNSDAAQLIIDDITCRGNITTECEFVTKKYFQDIGDVLNPEEIADARLRLGTLIQFRTVDVYLEKGRQRGHVVVVFDINETSNLLYELGAGYEYVRFPTYSKEYSYGLNGKITNFNFLGSGKQLSLSFSTAKGKDKSSGIANGSFGSGTDRFIYQIEFLNINRPEIQSFDLGYYDPHFLSSKHYYLIANLQYREYKSENYSYTRNFNIPPGSDFPYYLIPELQIFDYTRKYYDNKQSLLLGKRFARHSFVSIDTQRESGSGYGENTFGLTYGWNSEDDTLFPTKGSTFSSRISRWMGRNEVNVHYKNNVALDETHVFSFGGNATYNLANNYCLSCGVTLDNSYSASVFGRYNNINAIDKRDGTYAGWHIGFYYGQGNIGDEFFNHHFSGVNAGYTYQQENFIYRFSLAFNQQEAK